MFGARFSIQQIIRREGKRNREGEGEKREKTDDATVLLNLGDGYFEVYCTALPNL